MRSKFSWLTARVLLYLGSYNLKIKKKDMLRVLRHDATLHNSSAPDVLARVLFYT
jgi:hypothetical protein